jgi:hypothetical protein
VIRSELLSSLFNPSVTAPSPLTDGILVYSPQDLNVKRIYRISKSSLKVQMVRTLGLPGQLGVCLVSSVQVNSFLGSKCSSTAWHKNRCSNFRTLLDSRGKSWHASYVWPHWPVCPCRLQEDLVKLHVFLLMVLRLSLSRTRMEILAWFRINAKLWNYRKKNCCDLNRDHLAV